MNSSRRQRSSSLDQSDPRVGIALVDFFGDKETFDLLRNQSGAVAGQADLILNLTEYERLVVWAYASTRDWHARINRALWLYYQADVEPTDAVLVVCHILDLALRKLPKFRGRVFRGYHSEVRLDRFLRSTNYKVGMELQWPAFLSTSKNPSQAYSGNILFTILSRNGRVLGYYSPQPDEEEVLFPCFSWFRIRAIESRADKAFIEMVESNG